MKKTDNILAWKILLTIGQTGSLKSAAKQLWLDPPIASRMLSALEDELGIFILDRRSRPAKLTAEASELLPYINEMLRHHEALLSLTDSIKKEHGSYPCRTLHISLPVNMDRTSILSALLDYESEHKNVHFEISADRGLQALLTRKTDISFCFYSSDQADLHGIYVDDFYTFLLASRDFLNKYGNPLSIADLIQCPLLVRYQSSPYYADYIENGNERFKLRNCRKINYGDAITCKEMLLAGAGISVDLNLGVVREQLQNEFIVPVLPRWHRPVARANVYCRSENKNSPLYQEIMNLIAEKGNSDLTSPWRKFSKKWRSFE